MRWVGQLHTFLQIFCSVRLPKIEKLWTSVGNDYKQSKTKWALFETQYTPFRPSLPQVLADNIFSRQSQVPLLLNVHTPVRSTREYSVSGQTRFCQHFNTNESVAFRRELKVAPMLWFYHYHTLQKKLLSLLLLLIIINTRPHLVPGLGCNAEM